jgi:hypothetical protein
MEKIPETSGWTSSLAVIYAYSEKVEPISTYSQLAHSMHRVVADAHHPHAE